MSHAKDVCESTWQLNISRKVESELLESKVKPPVTIVLSLVSSCLMIS